MLYALYRHVHIYFMMLIFNDAKVCIGLPSSNKVSIHQFIYLANEHYRSVFTKENSQPIPLVNNPNLNMPDINFTTNIPANTRRWPNVGLMLAQRRRRWANVSPTLGQQLVFAGIISKLLSKPNFQKANGADKIVYQLLMSSRNS